MDYLRFKTMRLGFLLLFCSSLLASSNNVLIVADEFPAMEVLATRLKASEGIDSTLVKQTAIPQDLSKFSALIVYIHLKMEEPAEKTFIQYAESGGKLVLLHHSISSGKRPNKYWFPFLKIDLPEGDFEKGGYRWIQPVTIELVNLAPKEYITTHKLTYPSEITYVSSEAGGDAKPYPGVKLEGSEVYLNHVFLGPRTILLGLKYTDAKTGKTYMQDRAGWYMPAKKGWVIYLMAGHSARDFENPTYGQIVTNAVTFLPQ